MSQNPYQAPAADVDFEPVEQPARALELARRQRVLLMTFLVNLLASIGIAFLPPRLAGLAALTQIVVALAMLVATARIAWVVYSKPVAVLMSALALVPFLNLLVLLSANSRANWKLKQLGVRVGFMGVDIDALENALSEERKRREPVIGSWTTGETP